MTPQPSRPPEQPRPARRPGPAYAKLYLSGLTDDPTLTAGEKLALSLLLNHQQVAGGGWVILKYETWAQELGRSKDHVRRVVRELNARYDAGQTEWKVLVRYRRFGLRQAPNAFRVRIPEDVREEWQEAVRRGRGDDAGGAGAAGGPPGANAGGGRAQAPASRRAQAPSPLGAQAPSIKERDLKKGLKEGGVGETAAPLFELEAPADVNLFHAARGGDLGGTLARLVEAGEVAFVQWEGRWRVLGRAESDAQGVTLFLASEDGPDRSEAVRVHPRRLGALRFGR